MTQQRKVGTRKKSTAALWCPRNTDRSCSGSSHRNYIINAWRAARKRLSAAINCFFEMKMLCLLQRRNFKNRHYRSWIDTGCWTLMYEWSVNKDPMRSSALGRVKLSISAAIRPMSWGSTFSNRTSLSPSARMPLRPAPLWNLPPSWAGKLNIT